GTRDTRRAFYAALRDRQRCAELDDATATDVLARCRLLRNLPVETATGLMHAMARVLSTELDRTRPSAVLCHMVDEYVTHLLSLLAQRRGIRFVGYGYSYFPGFIQVTQQGYGRALKVREPMEAEIDAVLSKIGQREFRQNYVQRGNYTLTAHLKGLL